MKVKTGVTAGGSSSSSCHTGSMNPRSSSAVANAQVSIDQANKAVLSGGGLDIVNQLNVAVGVSNALALDITINA
jgi:hypothetical protein